MVETLALPLAACADRTLVGGKAAGLGELIRHGFRVPPGICLTTAAYRLALDAAPLDPQALWTRLEQSSEKERARLLAEAQVRVVKTRMPPDVVSALANQLDQLGLPGGSLWAVRSSATDEDAGSRSLAGLYDTLLGIPQEGLLPAILECWASLWTNRRVEVALQTTRAARPPQMAVIVQSMIDARAAGVAFSADPVSGRKGMVVLNGVLGLGAPLVAGAVMPDEWVVQFDEREPRWTIVGRRIAPKVHAVRLGPEGLAERPVVGDETHAPVLSEEQVVDLAQVARRAETMFGYPVDLEWALDPHGLWLLQVRPITTILRTLTNETSEWSRANFKETLPEIPSPMGLSFLQEYMEDNMLRHYRRLGCVIPPGVTSVRVVQGRPFINVSLFQSLVAQLGSNPALVTEQMGGQGSVPACLPPRMSMPKYLRALFLLLRQIRQVRRRAPAWFEAMKRMAQEPPRDTAGPDNLESLLRELDRLGRRLRQEDPTFAIAVGVGQGLDVLGRMLGRWFPSDWRAVMNGVLQGQASVISARQILWLADLADAARAESAVSEYFLSEPWEPAHYRSRLAGTGFLTEWDRFFDAYGHRGLHESDLMSPRHADQPEALLGVIRTALRHGVTVTSRDAVARQEATRSAVLARIREATRWRPGAWPLFRWWHRRLCEFLALRESNRHHLMYFLLATRRIVRRLGAVLVAQGRLNHADDMFFLTIQEVRGLSQREDQDWASIVASRRSDHVHWAAMPVPDFVASDSDTRVEIQTATEAGDDLRGLPISPGVATGPVCIVRRLDETGGIRPGAILVVAVLDPGLAPYFGVVAGVVAEMGGTLSHGAIIAREYGVPTIANVPNVTRILLDGERVVVDASAGVVRRVA